MAGRTAGNEVLLPESDVLGQKAVRLNNPNPNDDARGQVSERLTNLMGVLVDPRPTTALPYNSQVSTDHPSLASGAVLTGRIANRTRG